MDRFNPREGDQIALNSGNEIARNIDMREGKM